MFFVGPKMGIFPYSVFLVLLIFQSQTRANRGDPRVFAITGHTLTTEDVIYTQNNAFTVKLSDGAINRIRDSFNLVIDAASQATPVYGLTVGVGHNKDTPVFGQNGKLSPEARKKSEKFNLNILKSHSAGSGDPIDPALVRSAMVIRLNQIAGGHVGCQPRVAEQYVAFINHDLVPVVPEDGSVGMSDILLSSHIGLAMTGNWDVFRAGERVPAREAMREVGIQPLVPFAKDALSILSNNALSTSVLLGAIGRAERLVRFSPILVAASLEATNGNISPLLPHVIAVRPFPSAKTVSELILTHLSGSYLFERDPKRPLQDPLSYRGAHWPIAHAVNKLKELKNLLQIHINSSDDNPTVYVNAPITKYNQYSQVSQYFTTGKEVSGAICSTSNYDTTQLASEAECFLNAIVQLAKYSANRQIKLYNPEFTGLPRALVDPKDQGGQAYSALQKTVASLLTDVTHDASPLSFQGLAMQGEIEDVSTNLLEISENMIDALRDVETIYGMELMQSAQALDLRKKFQNVTISSMSENLRRVYRQSVPHYGHDRPITPDIQKSAVFVRSLKMTDRKHIKDPTGQFLAETEQL